MKVILGCVPVRISFIKFLVDNVFELHINSDTPMGSTCCILRYINHYPVTLNQFVEYIFLFIALHKMCLYM